MSIWADVKRKENLKLARQKLDRMIRVFKLTRLTPEDQWKAIDLGEMPYRKYLAFQKIKGSLLDYDAMFCDVESNYFKKWVECNLARA